MDDEKRHDPHGVLETVFGYSSFRGLQEEVVSAAMQGQDLLVVMPTGSGKSLCYQLPILCREGMGLVVSPLIALMNDQVAAMRQLGIEAAALHSELEADELGTLRDQLRRDEIKILYISPERLLAPGVASWLGKRQISLIAIDEAHCVSVWGHDFRPDYRELARLPGYFPGVPRLALTATADPNSQKDILASLDMRDAREFVSSFHRPNLHLAARPKNAEITDLLAILKPHEKHASIVYCGTRNKTEAISEKLQKQGFVALPFHAGLSSQEKRAVLTRFRSGEPLVVVATIAFGMGIDRPDVRCVVHLDMPASPEAYYQQIGRAGRDGERSQTYLLFGMEDIARARYWLDQSAAPEEARSIARNRLDAMIAFAETTKCRTQQLLACFGEDFEGKCGHCDNCQRPLKLFDASIPVQKALSAIYRMGQRFGATQVVSVLRGRLTTAVAAHAHQHLTVFGTGKDETERWWRSLLRQLVAHNIIMLDGEHKVLKLNGQEVRPILRGERAIMLKDERGLHKAASRAVMSERVLTNMTVAEEDAPIFEALRNFRKEEARRQNIPPYLVFHDSVIAALCAEKPSDMTALEHIRGLGNNKIARYGQQILDIMRAHGRALPRELEAEAG